MSAGDDNKRGDESPNPGGTGRDGDEIYESPFAHGESIWSEELEVFEGLVLTPGMEKLFWLVYWDQIKPGALFEEGYNWPSFWAREEALREKSSRFTEDLFRFLEEASDSPDRDDLGDLDDDFDPDDDFDGDLGTCDVCGKNKAEYIVVAYIRGEEKEFVVCRECLVVVGMREQLNEQSSSSALPDDLDESRHCPVCGWTLGDFIRTGDLGCMFCYQTFRKEVEAILEEAEGVALVPGKKSEEARRSRIEFLRRQLEKAIEAERFEDAARIRDMLRRIEEE